MQCGKTIPKARFDNLFVHLLKIRVKAFPDFSHFNHFSHRNHQTIQNGNIVILLCDFSTTSPSLPTYTYPVLQHLHLKYLSGYKIPSITVRRLDNDKEDLLGASFKRNSPFNSWYSFPANNNKMQFFSTCKKDSLIRILIGDFSSSCFYKLFFKILQFTWSCFFNSSLFFTIFNCSILFVMDVVSSVLLCW